MSTTPKIILVDDHLLFREGIRLLIETEGMGVVIAEAPNGKLFLDMLPTLDPDLVLWTSKCLSWAVLKQPQKQLH